jgi:hypothetical protein
MPMSNRNLVLKFSGVALVALLATGCNETGFSVAPVTAQINGPDPLAQTVCDPFGGGGTVTKNNGIESTLTYLPSTAPEITAGLSTLSFEPTAPDVVLSPVRLLLSQLNISTRPFTEGFATKADGTKLVDLNGNLLDEYFSVRGTSNLQLATGDPEGDYEVALLSDDGSTLDLDLDGNGNFQRWINNDGTHGNDFMCAPQVLHMTDTSLVPMKINYYQGPRVRIALMMLWRPKNASAESECGQYRADSYYFNPVGTNPSVPTANYNALLTRGWKPISAANYVLPDSKTNPCAGVK